MSGSGERHDDGLTLPITGRSPTAATRARATYQAACRPGLGSSIRLHYGRPIDRSASAVSPALVVLCATAVSTVAALATLPPRTSVRQAAKEATLVLVPYRRALW